MRKHLKFNEERIRNLLAQIPRGPAYEIACQALDRYTIQCLELIGECVDLTERDLRLEVLQLTLIEGLLDLIAHKRPAWQRYSPVPSDN